MGIEMEYPLYKHTGERGRPRRVGQAKFTQGILSKGIFLLILYLFLGNLAIFSSQTRWLVLIGIGIWWLSK